MNTTKNNNEKAPDGQNVRPMLEKTYQVMTKGRKVSPVFAGNLAEVIAWLDANAEWEYAGTDGTYQKRAAWRLPWRDLKQEVEVCSLQRRAATSEIATHSMAWVPDNDVRHLTHRATPEVR